MFTRAGIMRNPMWKVYTLCPFALVNCIEHYDCGLDCCHVAFIIVSGHVMEILVGRATRLVENPVNSGT